MNNLILLLIVIYLIGTAINYRDARSTDDLAWVIFWPIIIPMGIIILGIVLLIETIRLILGRDKK